MPVGPAIKLTRKQIYDEIWSVAVSGMALKYSIPYSSLMKQIKDAGIPVPPSGLSVISTTYVPDLIFVIVA